MISEVRDRLYSLFRQRRSDYQTTFKGVVADRVLADLAEFCRARETTFHTDNRLHAVLEGRREVWLRINKYLNLTEREIQQLIEKKEAGG